ncbi:MAG: glycosyltransferase family 87 protein [bacterium]
MLAHRVRAWLRSSPQPRFRKILFALYVATAALDAGGKAIAANPDVNRALRHRVGASSVGVVRRAGHPSGNFEIFRTASRHLLTGQDLYAEYPDEHSDRFKYSPTFALLFEPLAWIPSPIALFFWSLANALVLFGAVERALPGRRGLLALLCLLLEVLRGMQNAQSNALVAGLIILTFVTLERASAWRAAAAVMLGACVKIFPLAALTLALPRRSALRTGVRAAAVGVGLAVLPLLVTPPATLLAQYHSWLGVEASDSRQRWFSVMQLLYNWTGIALPNWPIQLAGTLALLAPLALRRDRWDDVQFRFLYLCSVLLYVVLFNHQAERASYLIAFVGATLWYASSEKERWQTWLYATAFVTTPLMSTLIPGEFFRTPLAVLYRLAVPALTIWIFIQVELLRGSRASARRGSAGHARGEVDADVALQR